MPVELAEITVGRTKRIPFTILLNNLPYNLDGHEVTLILRKSTGGVNVDTVGDVTIDPDQVANPGKVYYKPDTDDFSPVGARLFVKFRIVDAAGDVSHFPESQADWIEVVAA